MRASRKSQSPAPQAASVPSELQQPQAEETGLPADVLEFASAIDEYKRKNQRLFPTWGEVLGVLKSLGYRKSA